MCVVFFLFLAAFAAFILVYDSLRSGCKIRDESKKLSNGAFVSNSSSAGLLSVALEEYRVYLTIKYDVQEESWSTIVGVRASD